MPVNIKKRRREVHRQNFLKALERDLINNHWNQKELAIRHNKSQSVISRTIREITKTWNLDDRSDLIQKRLLRIKQHEKIYTDEMNAWEESKKPKHEITRVKMPCGTCRSTGYTTKDDQQVECTICNGTGIRVETTVKVSKSSGNTNHHATALRALQEICRLEGLYPEKKSSTRVSMNSDGSLQIDSIYDHADSDQLLEAMTVIENLKQHAQQKMRGDVIDVEGEVVERKTEEDGNSQRLIEAQHSSRGF